MKDSNSSLESATHEEQSNLYNVLLVLSGQKTSSDEEMAYNYSMFMPFFKKSFGSYKITEIELAYQLGREGKLLAHDEKVLRIFRELNYASASDVMLAYEEYKKEQLGQFIQNQNLFLSEKKDEIPSKAVEVLGIREMLRDSWSLCSFNTSEDYDIERNTIKDKCLNHFTGTFIYDQLNDLGLIDLTTKDKKEIQRLAEAFFKKELNQSREMLTHSFSELKRLASNFDMYNNGFVILCKKIALAYQIHKWIKSDTYLEEIESKIN